MRTHLTLSDVEAIRMILSGASVIDWRRPAFRSMEEVRDFLRLQELRLERDVDRERLWALHARAVQYLELSFGLKLPSAVIQPRTVEDLFLLAAGRGDDEIRRSACMILKVMHIVHHLDARELGFLLPLSDRQFFALAEKKVLAVVEAMQREGHLLAEAAVSRKLKDSLITKLLAKRENIAAQIYDKLRVRIVTRTREDLVPALVYLTRHLFPFNYVIPGESRNRLLDLRHFLSNQPDLRDEIPSLQEGVGMERGERPQETKPNEFSGQTYRDVSFVVDLPLRVPDDLWQNLGPAERSLGAIVFALVEFQVVDEATALENERGDGSHEAYKRRQMQRVLERLSDGRRPG
jgi:uncharacterized protein (TIGR04552 family)